VYTKISQKISHNPLREYFWRPSGKGFQMYALLFGPDLDDVVKLIDSELGSF